MDSPPALAVRLQAQERAQVQVQVRVGAAASARDGARVRAGRCVRRPSQHRGAACVLLPTSRLPLSAACVVWLAGLEATQPHPGWVHLQPSQPTPHNRQLPAVRDDNVCTASRLPRPAVSHGLWVDAQAAERTA